MTTNINIESLSREFCELTGKVWHEKTFPECGVSNPDFSDAREVLGVMRKRSYWYKFYQYLCQQSKADWVDLVIISGLLLKEAVEFLRREG